MLIQVIENILLGFAISAAPGAVFFETIRRALSKKDSTILFQLGNFSGMIMIAIISLAGVAVFFSHSAVATLFYATSGALLLYIGAHSLFSKPRYDALANEQNIKSSYSAFVSGLILAVANPLGIIFWISLTGRLQQQSGNEIILLVNVLSVIMGALILFVLLVSTVKYLRKKIKETHLIVMSRVSGLIIIFYGLAALGKLLT